MSFIFAPYGMPTVPVLDEKNELFPVHRVYCVGANYTDHVREVGGEGRERPFFFCKPADALDVCVNGKPISIPYARDTEQLDLEVELVVAIGKTAPAVGTISAEEAEDYIYGYGAGVEFTRRDWQRNLRDKRLAWEKAKAFDHSALITEIRPKERTPEIDSLEIWLYVNNEKRQAGRLNQMIWSVPEIISELSTSWRLCAGDLIFTGTPAGTGPILAGQSFEGGVSGVGVFKGQIVPNE